MESGGEGVVKWCLTFATVHLPMQVWRQNHKNYKFPLFFFYILNVGATVYMLLLTNWQLRITATSLLILKDPFSLDTKTINTSQNTRTVRWHDDAWLAYNAVYEIGPHVHTSLTGPAALWHILDRRFGHDMRPDIDICQHPLKRLRRVKSSSHRVLFLTQD